MGTSTIGLGEQAFEQGANRAEQIADEQRRANLGFLLTAYSQTQNPAQRQAIGYEIGQLYPPHKAHHFLRDIFHLRGKQPSPTPTAASTAPVSSVKTPQGTNLAQVKQVAQASSPEDAWNLIYRIPSVAQEKSEALKQQEDAATALENLRGKYALEEAQLRANSNITMQKLDAASELLGYPNWASAPPKIRMEAMKEVSSAGRSPQKPTFEWNQAGHLIAIKTNPDGTQSAQEVLDSKGQPIGKFNPIKISKRNGFFTFTDADKNLHQVPITTETESYFEPLIQAAQAAPVSPSTSASAPPSSSPVPAPPPVPSPSRRNGAPVRAKTSIRKVPTSAQTDGVGRILGNEGSPEMKADVQLYTKAAEVANTKEVAYQKAAQAAENPTPTSDQELIYAWVRSNVQGAGRMTQAEFRQAKGVGSVPMRLENWISLAQSGMLTPKMRQFMLADMKDAAYTAQAEATNLRNRVRTDEGVPPVSSKTPSMPSSTSTKDPLGVL